MKIIRQLKHSALFSFLKHKYLAVTFCSRCLEFVFASKTKPDTFLHDAVHLSIDFLQRARDRRTVASRQGYTGPFRLLTAAPEQLPRPQGLGPLREAKPPLGWGNSGHGTGFCGTGNRGAGQGEGSMGHQACRVAHRLSLPSLQGFSPPDGVSQPSWLFPSLLGRVTFFPPEKTQTPFASPKAMQLPRPIWKPIRSHAAYT